MRVIVAVLAPVSRLICGVVHAGVEQAHDRPALGDVAELVQRAQVAQEPRGLVAVLEAHERVQEGVRVRDRQSSAMVLASCCRWSPTPPRAVAAW